VVDCGHGKDTSNGITDVLSDAFVVAIR